MAKRRPPRTGPIMVMDNEAVSALFRPDDHKHKALLAHIEALRGTDGRQSGRLLMPRIVKVEAGVDYRDPKTISGRHLADPEERPLEADQADRAAARQRDFGMRGAVDSVVAQVAVDEAVATGRVVRVLTSDVDDMSVLTGDAAHVEIVPL